MIGFTSSSTRQLLCCSANAAIAWICVTSVVLVSQIGAYKLDRKRKPECFGLSNHLPSRTRHALWDSQPAACQCCLTFCFVKLDDRPRFKVRVPRFDLLDPMPYAVRMLLKPQCSRIQTPEPSFKNLASWLWDQKSRVKLPETWLSNLGTWFRQGFDTLS